MEIHVYPTVLKSEVIPGPCVHVVQLPLVSVPVSQLSVKSNIRHDPHQHSKPIHL